MYNENNVTYVPSHNDFSYRASLPRHHTSPPPFMDISLNIDARIQNTIKRKSSRVKYEDTYETIKRVYILGKTSLGIDSNVKIMDEIQGIHKLMEKGEKV